MPDLEATPERMAFADAPGRMRRMPRLFARLLRQYVALAFSNPNRGEMGLPGLRSPGTGLDSGWTGPVNEGAS